MEKIPAACAMEWSIDLEMGLRSHDPDQRIKAIETIGMKLQEWSITPNISMAVADIYDLVPGEDRTFANTILLRLADTFRRGDNKMRSCILKIFLLELKHLVKKGKRYNGILAKKRVPNYLELLKRVKIVFDTGDTEAKALALRLFGCWADLAKDSAHIRHVILSSCRSFHVIEVKASLFAAGCFSLLSEDFACITLEILVSIISSSQSSSDTVFAAIRAFSKMRCSSFIASRVHKVGKKLILGSICDEYKAAMLLSLSNLSVISPILIADQVQLLQYFLNKDTNFLLKARALKCLYLLLDRGSYTFAVDSFLLDTLFRLADNSGFTLSFQCNALRVLRKVFTTSVIHDQCFKQIADLVKELLKLGKEQQYSLKAKRNLSLYLFVDILCYLKRTGRVGWFDNPLMSTGLTSQSEEDPQDVSMDSKVDCGPYLVCQVISLVFDCITMLIRHIIADASKDSEILLSFCEAKEECKNLFTLILLLAKEYPQAGYIVIDGARTLIQTLNDLKFYILVQNACPSSEVSQADSSTVVIQPPNPDRQVCKFSELVTCIIRFMSSCCSILDDVSFINTELCENLVGLVESLPQNNFINYPAYEIYNLYMQTYSPHHLSAVDNYSTENLDNKKNGSELGYSVSFCWVLREWRSLGFVKKMLKERQFWAVYRAGKYACSEGQWFVAAFTFRKLISHIQSGSLQCWLKCLLLLAGSESEIKLLLYPADGIRLLKQFNTETELDEPIASTVFVGLSDTTCSNLHGCEGIAKIHSRMCSAATTLPPAGMPATSCYFQRWFLNLRVMFLGVMVDVLRLQSSFSFAIENLKNEKVNGNFHIIGFRQCIGSLMPTCVQIAKKLNKLAKLYDLLAISFMDMDCHSSRNISAAALLCSLLAFSTAFAIYYLDLPVQENSMPLNAEKFLSTELVQDLLERFRGIDDKISSELWQFLTASCREMDHLHFDRPRKFPNQEARAYSSTCQLAISGLLHIQDSAKRAKDEEGLLALMLQSLNHLSENTRRLMQVPFQVPKYFFQMSPSIGSEIYVFNADRRCKHELSVACGAQLSLNVCIQLKGLSRTLCSQVAKVYCILAARVSNHFSTEAPRGSTLQDLNDEIFDLNIMLRNFVKADMSKTDGISYDDADQRVMVKAFACLEPNEKGQGFSSCLLDVSAFPKGSYQIKWHCCCIDQGGNYWSLVPLNDCPLIKIKPRVSFHCPTLK